jgi:hypothetical protein
MIRDAHDRMTDQEELDAEQDEILYSSLDYFPGEPETKESLEEQYQEWLVVMGYQKSCCDKA